MAFSRIGSRANCGGSGCNAKLVYGATVYLEEKDGQALARGTVLCVHCATEGAPRDNALLAKAEGKGDLSEREVRRAEWLLDQAPEQEARAKLWSTLESRRKAEDRRRNGSDETEMKREARVKAADKADLAADDLAFLAFCVDRDKVRAKTAKASAK